MTNEYQVDEKASVSTVPDRVRNVGPVRASVCRSEGEWSVVAERDDAPFGPDHRYSVHRVALRPDLGQWAAVGSGDYDLSWPQALERMMAR